MSPPIIRTMFLLIAIPSPVPCILSTRGSCPLAKGSNIFSRKSLDIPIPLSSKTNSKHPTFVWLQGRSLMVKRSFPPSGVYFTAFPMMLVKTFWIRRLSPITFSWTTSVIFTEIWCLCSWIWLLVIDSILSISSESSNSSSTRSTLPDSILFISNTSFIRLSKCLLAWVIFARLSCTLSLSSMCAAAMAVIPMMAFIGVRISWDMEDKKSVFALFAASATL